MLYSAQNMPKYELSLVRIFPHMDKIADSVNIRENTDTLLSLCVKTRIRGSPYFGIFYAVIVINQHRAFFLMSWLSYNFILNIKCEIGTDEDYKYILH